eukprot:TRINITY_DN243_c0_g1_i1.p1 TRINITY_DN243_c0_g1~~TRINITY_DN243_c0_g1_i1.p1  ORF type:complete len:566 (+),score=116.84 TRINITY_DN243_c0_g1_i1:72-1700(+)
MLKRSLSLSILDHVSTGDVAKPRFECLRPEDLESRQQKLVAKIADTFPHLPSSSLRILLNAYQWDPEKLADQYAENPEKVSKVNNLPEIDQEEESEIRGDECCSICFDEVDPSEMTQLMCKHRFCTDCLKGYLAVEVKEKKGRILCPGLTANKKRCQMTMDELMVLGLLGDREAEKKFIESLNDNFVLSNKNMAWCPSPGCANAVERYDVSVEKNECVQCDCGHSFCFECKQADHRPATCKMWASWVNMYFKGNLDSTLVVASISRPCPKCSVPIQKNDGCNHMHCLRCQFHFCWLCMDKFGNGDLGGTDGYSGHKCNKSYEPDCSAKSKQGELKRFQFHSDRFGNHNKSQDLETKKSYEEAIDCLTKNYGFSSIACQFLAQAKEQLIWNRIVLKSSYVFGFLRPEAAPYVNKDIFENLQNELEIHTEKLSSHLRDISTLTQKEMEQHELSGLQPLPSLKDQCVHQRGVAHNVLKGLLEASSLWGIDSDAETKSSFTMIPIRVTPSKRQRTESEDFVPCENCGQMCSFDALLDHMALCISTE